MEMEDIELVKEQLNRMESKLLTDEFGCDNDDFIGKNNDDTLLDMNQFVNADKTNNNIIVPCTEIKYDLDLSTKYENSFSLLHKKHNLDDIEDSLFLNQITNLIQFDNHLDNSSSDNKNRNNLNGIQDLENNLANIVDDSRGDLRIKCQLLGDQLNMVSGVNVGNTLHEQPIDFFNQLYEFKEQLIKDQKQCIDLKSNNNDIEPQNEQLNVKMYEKKWKASGDKILKRSIVDNNKENDSFTTSVSKTKETLADRFKKKSASKLEERLTVNTTEENDKCVNQEEKEKKVEEQKLLRNVVEAPAEGKRISGPAGKPSDKVEEKQLNASADREQKQNKAEGRLTNSFIKKLDIRNKESNEKLKGNVVSTLNSKCRIKPPNVNVEPLDETKVEKQFELSEKMLSKLLKESKTMVNKIERGEKIEIRREDSSILNQESNESDEQSNEYFDELEFKKKYSCIIKKPITKLFKRKNLTFTDAQVRKIEEDNKYLENRLKNVMKKSSGVSCNKKSNICVEASSTVNRRKYQIKTWNENMKIEKKLRDIREKTNTKAPWAVPVWI